MQKIVQKIVISIVAIGTAAATLAAAPAEAAGRGAPVVGTSSGAVEGYRSGSVDSFLGIPYAAPPTGELRWRPPATVEPWRGVRQATAYGNRCPAAASTNGPRSETEDCLFLNVQRPATARAGQRLPVYVWIHGGGLANGSGSQHDGSLIVRSTGAIVVTINYRLGVFGFLTHPGLTGESGETGEAGNYGLMDQQAALRWVQREIAAFGGDRRQVTIGGESAGGFSVCAHLSAPGSRGTFSRAVMQSGACLTQTVEQAEASGVAVAEAVGCEGDLPAAGASAGAAAGTAIAACLRSASVGALLDAPMNPGFVRDTPTLPVDPEVAVRTGRFARVPIIIGANRDEGRTFAQGFMGADQEAYVTWVRSTFTDRAEAVLARYPWPAEADAFTPAYLAGAIMTDSGMIAGIGGCAQRSLTTAFATYTTTFSYEFDHRTGPGLSPVPGYVWGAGHAAELAYFWPSFDNGTPIAPTFTAAERQLSADLARAWGSFVAGHHLAVGTAGWTSFGHGARTMALRAGGASQMITDETWARNHACDLWERES
ncbi:MAG: carboxylesterase family protein [Micromonosporaceae bacterium]|nr:carboxylesterase family protein [Micromonosporaceae bacterium]